MRVDSLKKQLARPLPSRERVDILNKLSHQNYDVNDSLAFEYSKQALKTSLLFNYPAGAKYAYTMQGQGYRFFDQQKAIDSFRKSDSMRVEGAELTTIYNHILWGNMLTDVGKFDSALLHYRKARILIQPDDVPDLQSIYINIARVFVKQWRTEEAFQYLDSANALHPQVKNPYMEMELMTYYGRACKNSGDFRKAEEYFDQVALLAQQEKDYYHQIQNLISQAQLFLSLGKFNESLKKCLQALELTKVVEFKFQYALHADVLIKLGEVYLELSQFELTAKYLFEALKLCKAKGLEHRTGFIYNNLGWLFKIEDKYDEALLNANQAMAIHKAVGDPASEAESYNIRGLIYEDQGEYNKALEEFKISLDIRTRIGHKEGVSATQFNMAEVYVSLNNYPEAIRLYKEAALFEQATGNNPYLAMTYGSIARLYINRQKFDEAMFYLKKIELLATEDQSLLIRMENAAVNSRYYEASGDFKKALTYQKLYQQWRDSVAVVNRVEKLAEYEAMYKMEKKEQEIELLNARQKGQLAQLKLKESQLNQRNIIIAFSFVVLTSFAVAGVRTYTSYQEKLRNNKALVRLNREIESKNQEVEANLKRISNLKSDLETRERQYSNLVENAPDLIYEVDEGGRFIYLNKVSMTVTGYSEEELCKMYFWEIIESPYAEKYTQDIIAFMKRREGRMYMEVPIKSKTGTRIWIGQNIRMIYEGSRMIRAEVVARDISLQKTAEEGMVRAKEQAEKASAVKSEFLANMSHEVRTPLNGVIGFADLLSKTELSDKQSKYVNTISKSARKLLQMINDILDFSKLEAKKVELDESINDTRAFAEQTIDLIAHQAQQRGIKISFSVLPDVPALFRADGSRLQQVLLNLLTNSLKFTEQGHIELKIENIGSDSRPIFRFSVTDTGIGIEPKYQQKIFEAFVQGDVSTTKKYGGTGLGLTISNDLLALMDSRLHLHSEPGRGSTFYFDLNFPES